MGYSEIVENLLKEVEDQKLILLVMDGVSDVRHENYDYTTPLEAAETPNLDALTPKSACGRMIPVDYGITPGSGPAHLGLFGYDPREVQIGRGVLEALGIDLDLQHGDVAARCNFCTMKDGKVTDRRAGRPPTSESAKMCELLQEELGEIEDVKLTIKPGKGHRFAVVFRGEGLRGSVSDTDPHENNMPILEAKPDSVEAEKVARIVNTYQQRALKVLQGEKPMNGILVRGVAERPRIRGMKERYGLKSAAIATYPMYRGLAKLAGMDLLQTGTTTADEFQTCAKSYEDYDFFFIHIKGTDEAGEDGNFSHKVQVIEDVDQQLPTLLELDPEVLAVTADHSTPCCMKLHSWHPIPLLLKSPRCDASGLKRFTEHECNCGSMGFFRSMYLMPLMMANAGLLDKFGA